MFFRRFLDDGFSQRPQNIRLGIVSKYDRRTWRFDHSDRGEGDDCGRERRADGRDEHEQSEKYMYLGIRYLSRFDTKYDGGKRMKLRMHHRFTEFGMLVAKIVFRTSPVDPIALCIGFIQSRHCISTVGLRRVDRLLKRCIARIGNALEPLP